MIIVIAYFIVPFILSSNPWNIFPIPVPVLFIAPIVEWITLEATLAKLLTIFSLRSLMPIRLLCIAVPVGLMM